MPATEPQLLYGMELTHVVTAMNSSAKQASYHWVLGLRGKAWEAAGLEDMTLRLSCCYMFFFEGVGGRGDGVSQAEFREPGA